MGPEPSDSDPRPAFPRTTTILLALDGATIAAFGIAAIRAIFAPVFLAFVLTLCVHPLPHRMQRHGIPRGMATGATIAAVFALRWRPLTGDQKDLEVILQQEDDAIRARRGRRGAVNPNPGGKPKA